MRCSGPNFDFDAFGDIGGAPKTAGNPHADGFLGGKRPGADRFGRFRRQETFDFTVFIARPEQGGHAAGGCATPGGSPSADITPAASGTAMAVPNWDDPVDDALLDHAAHVLARRLGPIARMMVARAASRASTRGAFCLALVKLAGDATDGEALMADLQKASGTR